MIPLSGIYLARGVMYSQSVTVILEYVDLLRHMAPQGVVILIAPVPFATGIKIFDWLNFILIA